MRESAIKIYNLPWKLLKIFRLELLLLLILYCYFIKIHYPFNVHRVLC